MTRDHDYSTAQAQRVRIKDEYGEARPSAAARSGTGATLDFSSTHPPVVAVA